MRRFDRASRRMLKVDVVDARKPTPGSKLNGNRALDDGCELDRATQRVVRCVSGTARRNQYTTSSTVGAASSPHHLFIHIKMEAP